MTEHASASYASQVLATDRTNAWRIINLVAKAALLLAFVIALTVDIDALEGKAMGFRAPMFTAPIWVVYAIAKIRNWDPYPHTADALITLPFLLDTLGNMAGLFDSVVVFDDILHFVNWSLLVGSFHAFRFRNVFDRRDAVLLGAGFGALAIVAWEILEWAVSEDGFGGAGGLALTYEDTVGDLTISTVGGVLGSVLAVRLLGPLVRTT